MIYGKLMISANIEVLTGMHIGGSDAYSAIGAVDSPVIRDVLSGLPMIPGSSLKGKLRSLLAKKYNPNPLVNHSDDSPEILRLFGSTDKPSRILVSDMVMSQKENQRIQDLGVDGPTEVKFENTINRITSEANPRQIERVIKGTKFDMEIIYEISEEEEAIEDIKLLKEGLDLLRYDYLGGHGSRGYGRVHIGDIEACPLTENLEDDLLDKINSVLSHD